MKYRRQCWVASFVSASTPSSLPHCLRWSAIWRLAKNIEFVDTEIHLSSYSCDSHGYWIQWSTKSRTCFAAAQLKSRTAPIWECELFCAFDRKRPAVGNKTWFCSRKVLIRKLLSEEWFNTLNLSGKYLLTGICTFTPPIRGSYHWTSDSRI